MKFDAEFVIWLVLAVGVGILASRASCNCPSSSEPPYKDWQ